jgi:hypothetical protein
LLAPHLAPEQIADRRGAPARHCALVRASATPLPPIS